ncbi:threonine-phosphate decarboxylase CobD [Sporosarcina sp. ITBMC105]
MQLPEHGANPHHVYKRLGIEPPKRTVDFSENCNPEGPPKNVIEMWPALLSTIPTYPDPSGEPFLSEVAAYHHVSPAAVIAGNGAAELLSLLAERYRGKRAIVVHPTFSEYEATLRAKGVEPIRVLATEQDGFKLPVAAIIEKLPNAAALYLCTPNNPTGILPSREELLSLIVQAGEAGCEVILDEAFIDFVDEEKSFIPNVQDFPHVIVVRSMTKMYAIPGIRLGYAIANPDVIKALQAIAPHWNVNGIAAAIGAQCLHEEAYRARAIEHAAEQRQQLQKFLEQHACTVTDAQANFLSFKPAAGLDARKLYKDLLTRGIVLRHSENFHGMDGRWLRVGMKRAADMALLQRELTDWFARNRE